MQPNTEYIINSLGNQVARLSVQVAERESVIAELQQELDKLKGEKIDEMDSAE